MDADLRSIAQARQAVTSARAAFDKFRGASQETIDRIVEAMVVAIEPECGRLGDGSHRDRVWERRRQAVQESVQRLGGVGVASPGPLCGGAVARRDHQSNGGGRTDGGGRCSHPVTNPTSTVIFKVLSAVKAGNAIVCAPHPRAVRCCAETARVMAEAAEAAGAPKGLISCLTEVTLEEAAS